MNVCPPADLSVAYGKSDTSSKELQDAMARVGQSAKSHGVAYMTWVPNVEVADAWRKHGFTTFVLGSEHAWMLHGAKAAVGALKNS